MELSWKGFFRFMAISELVWVIIDLVTKDYRLAIGELVMAGIFFLASMFFKYRQSAKSQDVQ